MSANPLELALSYWKLLGDEGGSQIPARYTEPDEAPRPGVCAVAPTNEPTCHRVVDRQATYLLYAAVHPIPEPPDSAEVIAEIRDDSDRHCSFVLWFPRERSVLVPFDPNAAIEALRMERYVAPGRRTVLPSPALKAYYALKPLVPRSITRGLRQRMARRTQAGGSTPVQWPVDRSQDQLMALLLRVALLSKGGPAAFLWFWPNEHPWAAVLTHDVETADGASRVRHVMDLETEKGLRSSFNFVARDYEVSQSLLSDVRKQGFEIGVHGYHHDGLMFSDWQTFMERVPTVNECARQWGAVGFRSPATFRNLDWFHMLGFEYDSSVTDSAPFEPQPGGCASLFPYLVGNIVEMPMTLAQDHTLFGLLGQSDTAVWLSKLGRIRESHGMACVLTHPDAAAGYIGLPENEARYEEVLDFVAGSEAWAPLPRELARWWRDRTLALPRAGALPRGSTVASAHLDSDGGLRLSAPTRD